MLQKILFLILFNYFYSCTSQEKINEEKNDSAAIFKNNDTLIKDFSEQNIKQNLSGISEQKKSEKNLDENKPDEKANLKIQIKTFRNTEIGGYGYDIILDGKVYVHQPNIPALQGNNGFSTEEQARKVGELMIHKIEKNIMPPTIDVRELDSLGIQRNN